MNSLYAISTLLDSCPNALVESDIILSKEIESDIMLNRAVESDIILKSLVETDIALVIEDDLDIFFK